MGADSVSLLDEKNGASGNDAWGVLKKGSVLFLLFLLVNSDIFLNNVLTAFDGAIDGRDATNRGVVIQGIFLVLFYMFFSYFQVVGVL